MNATTSNIALSQVSTEGMSWLITIGIFIAILVTIFLLSKNFRRFLYGAVVSGVLAIVYGISRWIGVSTAVDKDYFPITGFCWRVGFIIVSIIIGYFLSKTKKVKEWEKNWLK